MLFALTDTSLKPAFIQKFSEQLSSSLMVFVFPEKFFYWKFFILR